DAPDRAWAMFPVGVHVSLGTSIAGEPAASACMVSTTSPSPPMNLILDLIHSSLISLRFSCLRSRRKIEAGPCPAGAFCRSAMCQSHQAVNRSQLFPALPSPAPGHNENVDCVPGRIGFFELRLRRRVRDPTRQNLDDSAWVFVQVPAASHGAQLPSFCRSASISLRFSLLRSEFPPLRNLT